MSVPENRRSESRLEVLAKAKDLAVYTTSICGNEKVFPKRDRWVLTNRIVSTVLEILENVNMANDIYVTTKGDFEVRRKCQTIALSSTAKLIALVDLAYMKYNISDTRITYWVGLIADTRELIKKWRQSDKRRFK